jgi:hypothetical protein
VIAGIDGIEVLRLGNLRQGRKRQEKAADQDAEEAAMGGTRRHKILPSCGEFRSCPVCRTVPGVGARSPSADSFSQTRCRKGGEEKPGGSDSEELREAFLERLQTEVEDPGVDADR